MNKQEIAERLKEAERLNKNDPVAAWKVLQEVIACRAKVKA
jgi:hypothetical protein